VEELKKKSEKRGRMSQIFKEAEGFCERKYFSPAVSKFFEYYKLDNSSSS
jgi:hypothetical protein